MRLYLIRHGETALNEKGCYYGKTDAVLSARGIAQAEYLRDLFKGISFDYDGQKKIAEQIGVDAYLTEFATWFGNNTTGTCTR